MSDAETKELVARTPVVHELKILAPFYEDVASGAKTFEIRKDDRDYRIGDILTLRCWDPEWECFVGKLPLHVKVKYILRNSEYVPAGYCCMSVELMAEGELPMKLKPGNRVRFRDPKTCALRNGYLIRTYDDGTSVVASAKTETDQPERFRYWEFRIKNDMIYPGWDWS